MSLIQLLGDDNLWQEFLAKKKETAHLPKKVLAEYESFINQKGYQPIATQLLAGEYTFSTPKKVLISKMGKTKKRTVYLFTPDENYILKMLTFLLHRYDYLFCPNLYSFRQDRGVKQAIFDLTKRNRLNQLYGYKVDIKNYFNSVDVSILLTDLQTDLADHQLFRLIESLLTDDYVLFNHQRIKEQKGVMAGVPVSAFLANYYLRELDNHFYRHGVAYFRYADDLIVFAETLDQLQRHRQFILDFLHRLHLEINPDKEYLYHPKEKLEFLGFSYQNGVIDLSDNTIKKIKGKIRRTARGLRRWKIRKAASDQAALKAMNRKFNRKFYGQHETDLTWKYWFFPTINTTQSLKLVDRYMQEQQRYLVTGKHNKANYQKVPYQFLKDCNYRPLVHEYYNQNQPTSE